MFLNLVRDKSQYWFKDVVNGIDTEQTNRINNVLRIKQYLLRKHDKVLARKDFKLEDGTTVTSTKLIYNSLKSVIDFHTGYVVGNPVSITGLPEIVKKYNAIYKKGMYSKTDYQVVQDLYTYGNSFEYVYLDNNNVIRSKIINNTDSYPVYNENNEYVSFIEHWNETVYGGHDNYIVYSPTVVQTYQDDKMVSEVSNLSGLPIHYSGMHKDKYDIFGDSMMLDLMPIMDDIEVLSSKLDDAVYKLSLNPIGVSIGQSIKTHISADITGATLNLEDVGDFKYATAMVDYNSTKLLLDHNTQQLYVTACVPSAVMGQSNISNVSEVSLKMLYAHTDNLAKQMIQVIKEGTYKRFEYIRKLLAVQKTTFTDDVFDSIDVCFTLNRPIDDNNMMKELQMQRKMNAISIQSIIDHSIYTPDTTLELQRLADEKKALQKAQESVPETNTDSNGNVITDTTATDTGTQADGKAL